VEDGGKFFWGYLIVHEVDRVWRGLFKFLVAY
jgi:hypothetical protein